MLPNFKECWWDHVLLDLFGMNLFGMWLGSLVVRYFEFHHKCHNDFENFRLKMQR